MSNLTIVDLDFCERELSTKRKVKGGLGLRSSSFSSSYSPAVNSAFNDYYSYSSRGEAIVPNATFGSLIAASSPSSANGSRASALAFGDSTYTSASLSIV